MDALRLIVYEIYNRLEVMNINLTEFKRNLCLNLWNTLVKLKFLIF